MIRPATHDDIPAIVEMGRAFVRSTGYLASVPENTAQFAATAALLIDRDQGVLFVADTAGGLVGMIGLLLFPHHFSGALTAGELVWWVNPSHRGIGVRLLRRAEQWALDQGATCIQMIAPQDAIEPVGQIYERLGYRAIETAYQRAL